MDKMFHKLTAAFLSALMLFNGIGVRAEDTPAPSSSPEPTVEASASADATASAEPSAEPDAPQLIEVAPDSTAEAGTSEPEQSSNALTVQRISNGNFATSFADGPTFNAKVKSLVAGKTVSSSEVDTLVKAIKQSSSAPDSSVTTVDLSSWQNGSIPAWFDSESGTVYWHYIPVKSHDLVLPLELSEDCTSMFSGFTNLTDFDFFDSNKQTGWDPLLGTWGAHALTDMFANCTSLEALDLSNFQSITSESTGVDTMLSGCTSLNKITFGNNSEDTYDPFVLPSTTTGFFPTPTKTASGVISNGKWGKDSEAAETTYSADELTALGKTKDALTGTWYAQATSAKFEAGPKFNQDVKGLTQDSLSYNSFYGGYYDYDIEKMVRSATAPADGTVTVDISEAKDGSIVAWFDKDSSTLYWYSSAHKILMNEDCSHMFELMGNLKSVDMTGWNAQLVTDTSSMFRWDERLSIDATIFNSAKNLQIISAMFEHSGIETIDVSGWQTSNLTDASYAFSNTWLTAIDLSAWDTSKISATNGMFQKCSSLTTINVADWKTGGVIDMSYMFYDCRVLASLNLSSWDTKNVTDMRFFAGNDSALTTMTFGENFITPLDAAMRQGVFPAPVKTASGKDSDGRWGLGSESADTEYAATALADLGTTAKTMAGTWYAQPLKAPKLESGPEFNVALKTLTANGSTSSITAYSENSSIKKLTRSSDAPASGITTADISDKQDKSIVAWFDTDTGTIYWYSTADTVLMNEDSSGMFANMTALESVDVSGLDSTIVSLATDMFWDDKSLKNVDATILNDAVGLSVISGIFANCANLEKIDVSGWQLGNLYYLSSAFQNCSSLKTLDVSKWNLSNVYDLNSVFAGCSSLIGLDVSNWDTSNVGSMDSTFSGCSSLVSIDVSKWDTSHVYAASGVFRGCSRLSAIDFSGWNTNGFEGVYELLSGCTNLRTITFGDGFIAPSGTETGYLRKDMFPTPLLTVSDHDSNGKWGFGSERASTTYTPDELAEHAATAKAMTGTWYAQKIETVTVTLDPNGGGGTPIVITLPKGKATPIPDPTGTDPRLPFKGWNTKKDGSGTSIPPGGEATLTEDTTLYAQWGDNPYLTDAGGIGITSAVALAALSGVLGVLMKRRRK